MTTHDIDDGLPFAPVIRTQGDLEAVWRRLMQPLGTDHGQRGRTSLWLILIQPDGVPVPQLTEITDLPGAPVRSALEGLAAMLADLADRSPQHHGARWAVLRTRPGHGPADDEDRAWAAMLRSACADVGVPVEPLYLATDREIYPVPLDELRSASG